MVFLKFFCGILFFILGWMYLFNSNLALTLNRIARESVFNDRLILLERKKLAILFFCLSFVALYMGFSALSQVMATRDKYSWTQETNQYLMYMAMQDYCTERYANAIEKYQTILKSSPDNAEVLKRMAFTFDAMGEKKKARLLWKKLLRMRPDDPEVRETLQKLK